MSPRPSTSGFTLVEILVVLIIVSVMMGVAVTNMPTFGGGANFDTEMKRLQLLLELAREEATVQSYEHGFKPVRGGYEFYRFDEGEEAWVVLDETPFQARSIPDELRLTLKVEDKDFSLGDKGEPPVLLLSSGETTPFTLRLQMGDTEDALVADGFSRIEIESEREARERERRR